MSETSAVLLLVVGSLLAAAAGCGGGVDGSPDDGGPPEGEVGDVPDADSDEAGDDEGDGVSDGLSDVDSGDPCPPPDFEPFCPGGSDSHEPMAPAGRMLLLETLPLAAEFRLSCFSAGRCLIVGIDGRAAPSSAHNAVCWVTLDSEPVSVACTPMATTGLFRGGRGPSAMGDALAGPSGGSVLVAGEDASSGLLGWYSACVDADGGHVFEELSVPAGSHVGLQLMELALVRSSDGRAALTGAWGPRGAFAWSDLGACPHAVVTEGTVVEWPRTALETEPCTRGGWHRQLDRAGVDESGGVVALGARHAEALPGEGWRRSFAVAFADTSGRLVAAPTETTNDVSLLPWPATADAMWPRCNPRTAVLDDGGVILTAPWMGDESTEDLADYRGLATIPPGGSAEPVPLRLMHHYAYVFQPVAMRGAMFALLWEERWNVGTTDSPVCWASCRPLTIMVGLDARDVERPPEEVLCLSMGGCVYSAQGRYVDGRLVVVWEEGPTDVHLAVVDVSEFAAGW